MAKPLTLYLDTSVLNFALGAQDPEKHEATLQLIEQVKTGVFQAAISEIVLIEINRAPDVIRRRLLKLIDRMPLTSLMVTGDARSLAQAYVAEGLIPLKYLNDALHIAIATAHNRDVVVSWNMEHMVKLKTRRGVNAVHLMQGYRAIDICTPQEVIDL